MQLATLKGHIDEVLHLAISPDGQTIVTGAANEILRFWNVFPSAISQIYIFFLIQGAAASADESALAKIGSTSAEKIMEFLRGWGTPSTKDFIWFFAVGMG
ncbi:hypothetical protein FH972_011280 [Carpinus fangiana]|uniref:Anaphase-promoting complex subunit 4 WD40 domain-containing protein n=1 Tax=Carpinus fangiana TaxID=176857 RepID=A0A660KTU9_9ROSI|nr:hypothetical protein FH972_011280 [Carpinus fangiana]